MFKAANIATLDLINASFGERAEEIQKEYKETMKEIYKRLLAEEMQ